MENRIGLNSFLNKIVVVKFFDEHTNSDKSVTGTLVDFNEEQYDENEKRLSCFVAIATETDYDRISLDNVRKIFIKE